MVIQVTRYEGEELVIGPLPDGSMVTLSVVEVSGNKVRLGVVAPQTVRVKRAEVVETEAGR